MNKPIEQAVTKAVDSIQDRLTSYACELNYDLLTPQAIHAAKVRIIDTLGALIGGFFGEPCQIVRNLAAQMPNPDGATVLGTRMKTTPDMAAFANATTARFAELTDSYHGSPGGGHISDTITPILAAAEHAHRGGRDYITAVVLAYEIAMRISNTYEDRGFDHTMFCCLATAVAASKLFGLTPQQISHAISMAVVPNNILRQVRTGELSMFKAAASGQGGRGGVFAALLAREGMEGPHLPFEGKAGWCVHVAKKRFSLDVMGGGGTPFRISDTQIKNRPACGSVIQSILAAEKVAPLSAKAIKHVRVETRKNSLENSGIGAHRWNPDSRETADHSIPYCVAATLMDGTITLRSFNDAHLYNPELRALMQKIEAVENVEFTKAYDRPGRPEHRARVTVTMDSGEELVGETGGDADDMGAEKSDAQISEKFRGLTEDVLGAKRTTVVLDRLWNLEDCKDMAEIPAALILA